MGGKTREGGRESYAIIMQLALSFACIMIMTIIINLFTATSAPKYEMEGGRQDRLYVYGPGSPAFPGSHPPKELVP